MFQKYKKRSFTLRRFCNNFTDMGFASLPVRSARLVKSSDVKDSNMSATKNPFMHNTEKIHDLLWLVFLLKRLESGLDIDWVL